MQVRHVAIGIDRDRTIRRLGADDDRIAIDRRSSGRVIVGQIHRVGARPDHRERIAKSRRRGDNRGVWIDIEFRRSDTVSIVRFLEDIVARPTVDATTVSESQILQNEGIIASPAADAGPSA